MNFLWTSGGWVMFSKSQLDSIFQFFLKSFRFILIFYKVQYSGLILIFFSVCPLCFAFPLVLHLWLVFDYMNCLGIIYLPNGIFIFIYIQTFTVSVAFPLFSNFQVTLWYFSRYLKLYSLVFLLEQSQWKKSFLVFLYSGLH